MHEKDNQQYFTNTKFIYSVFDPKKLPNKNYKEIIFVGRSNSGKSSIINSVTKKHNLAITSKTPGRTQAINYFEVKKNTFLVDLPGYGYANVSVKTKLFWSKILQQYLNLNRNIKGVIVIMDVRHPFKLFDLAMLDFCTNYNLPAHIVLNKVDQISKLQLSKNIIQAKELLLNYNKVTMQICSTIKLIGVQNYNKKLLIISMTNVHKINYERYNV